MINRPRSKSHLSIQKLTPGFSNTELAVAIAIVGTMLAVATTGYSYFKRRSHEVEGRNLLVKLTEAYVTFDDHESLPVHTTPQRFISAATSGGLGIVGLPEIGFSITGRTRYDYYWIRFADRSVVFAAVSTVKYGCETEGASILVSRIDSAGQATQSVINPTTPICPNTAPPLDT